MKKIFAALLAISFLCTGVVFGDIWLDRQNKTSVRDKLRLIQHGKPEIPAKVNGVFIWEDGGGWHIRWKSYGDKHSFYGKIEGDGGFVRARSLPIEKTEAEVTMGKKDMTFKAWNWGAEDGFDFRITPGTTKLEFDIYRDGKHYPLEVFVGAKNLNPEIVPFEIYL
ncbi:MAG: hypothetical protein M1269_01815 [Chloroflexi bacterium]|nr:hypothetical protein [Chloroflexota bacterium]